MRLKINGEIVESYSPGITLQELSKGDRTIVAALVNNQLQDLNTEIFEDSIIEFISINDEVGNRIYRRGLFMVLAKAVYELFPRATLSIEHSLSNGIYCELHKASPLSREDLNRLYRRMQEIVRADLPIIRHELPARELVEIYRRQGLQDKAELLEQKGEQRVVVYELEGYYDYFYYNMVPSTAYLKHFKLHHRIPGFILLYPQKGKPEEVPDFIDQPKLANIFHEYEKWGDIIGVGSVSELNKVIAAGKYGDLVRISEALHEKKLAFIADEISQHIDTKRIILIAGPSSSGKTTFAQRLAIHLRVNGLKPVAISTDNYFVNREETPRDEQGNYDFEALEAIDLELFNQHLIELLQGKEVEIPIFNFATGRRSERGIPLKIEQDQVIIIEGIHSLNRRLTSIIPQDNKFKIYVSALTQLNLDRHNRIPTTDTRLIRRIVRDHQFRGHTASRTISWWPAVRRGEEKNIFPYQENADLMFNSALSYELAVLKKYAEPLLKAITIDDPGYYQAQRLLNILNCFQEMPEEDIPRTSILKEFIGDSCFRS